MGQAALLLCSGRCVALLYACFIIRPDFRSPMKSLFEVVIIYGQPIAKLSLNFFSNKAIILHKIAKTFLVVSCTN